ncbi:membrane protein insertion efficiency factor YidD [bacterium]|nr:membrane protein insertion efficiency factor YidD [bacterium]
MLVLSLLDSYRSPADQVTAKIYVYGIRLYQTIPRPFFSRYVRCRYRPSCSEYSIIAVQRHGIRRGLLLSVKRIYACRKTVHMGTIDNVPD